MLLGGSLLGGDSDSSVDGGDGVLDLLEGRIRSNPFDPDTDDDGMGDLFEFPGTYPHRLDDSDSDDDRVPDGLEDIDGDGRNAFEEQKDGTDPFRPD